MLFAYMLFGSVAFAAGLVAGLAMPTLVRMINEQG